MTLSKRETATLVFYILSLLILLWVSEDRVVPISEATRVKEENQIKYEELEAEAEEFADDYMMRISTAIYLPKDISKRPTINMFYDGIRIESTKISLDKLCDWAEWYNKLHPAEKRYMRDNYLYFEISDTIFTSIDSAHTYYLNMSGGTK